jgi:hypothetical protein
MNQGRSVGNTIDDPELRYTQSGAAPRRLHGRGQPSQQRESYASGTTPLLLRASARRCESPSVTTEGESFRMKEARSRGSGRRKTTTKS